MKKKNISLTPFVKKRRDKYLINSFLKYKKTIYKVLILLVLLLVTSTPVLAIHSFNEHEWSAKETEVLRGLWIGSLAPLPLDPSNAYADDPMAVSLGKKIFSDTRFSGNNEVSCATCHQADYDFTDKLPHAHGLAFTRRRSMPLAGMGYSPWLFWDGRKDSLWSQALGPWGLGASGKPTRAWNQPDISGAFDPRKLPS